MQIIITFFILKITTFTKNKETFTTMTKCRLYGLFLESSIKTLPFVSEQRSHCCAFLCIRHFEESNHFCFSIHHFGEAFVAFAFLSVTSYRLSVAFIPYSFHKKNIVSTRLTIFLIDMDVWFFFVGILYD